MLIAYIACFYKLFYTNLYMEIFIFRHADKEFSSTGDPGLSVKGHKQAQAIAKNVEDKRITTPTELWCSPKVRAIETFEPTSQVTQLEIKIFPELDQRLYEESSKQFVHRIRSFIESHIKFSQKACLYLCTHSDWIEGVDFAAPLHTQLDFHTLMMPSANYLQFKIENDGKWKFIKKSGFEN